MRRRPTPLARALVRRRFAIDLVGPARAEGRAGGRTAPGRTSSGVAGSAAASSRATRSVHDPWGDEPGRGLRLEACTSLRDRLRVEPASGFRNSTYGAAPFLPAAVTSVANPRFSSTDQGRGQVGDVSRLPSCESLSTTTTCTYPSERAARRSPELPAAVVRDDDHVEARHRSTVPRSRCDSEVRLPPGQDEVVRCRGGIPGSLSACRSLRSARRGRARIRRRSDVSPPHRATEDSPCVSSVPAHRQHTNDRTVRHGKLPQAASTDGDGARTCSEPLPQSRAPSRDEPRRSSRSQPSCGSRSSGRASGSRGRKSRTPPGTPPTSTARPTPPARRRARRQKPRAGSRISPCGTSASLPG